MTEATKKPDPAEAEARQITESSDAEVREYFHQA
jgi:hypothetical protein